MNKTNCNVIISGWTVIAWYTRYLPQVACKVPRLARPPAHVAYGPACPGLGGLALRWWDGDAHVAAG
eukprot:1081863-Amphidinium_carterae.1